MVSMKKKKNKVLKYREDIILGYRETWNNIDNVLSSRELYYFEVSR